MATTNPFTGTPYNSWSDVEKDLKDHPECKAKVMAIWKRIQKLMTHNEIRELCGLWGCATPEETWGRINGMSDKELCEEVDKILKKRKKRAEILYNYTAQYETVYPAGVA